MMLLLIPNLALGDELPTFVQGGSTGRRKIFPRCEQLGERRPLLRMC